MKNHKRWMLMLLKLICLMAVISTALCPFLRFREVRRITKKQRNSCKPS